jgi:hypothetical protein
MTGQKLRIGSFVAVMLVASFILTLLPGISDKGSRIIQDAAFIIAFLVMVSEIPPDPEFDIREDEPKWEHNLYSLAYGVSVAMVMWAAITMFVLALCGQFPYVNVVILFIGGATNLVVQWLRNGS